MSLKSLLVAAAATLALTSAAMATNSASIYSEGDGNQNTIQQKSVHGGNNGQVWSTGNGTDNYIGQMSRGGHNEAGGRVLGNGNRTTVQQRDNF